MKSVQISGLLLLILALGLVSCQKKEADQQVVAEKKSEQLINIRNVTTNMTVQDINLEERLVTLQYAEGNLMVVRIEPNLVGLEEIAVGDEVEVKYLKSLAVFVTAPDSTRPPLSEKKTVTVELEEGKPVEYIVDVVEKVSTVMALDHDNRHAVLRDAEGIYHEVDISHEVDNLHAISVGDEIVYHHTESMAIHIAKTERRKI